MRKITTSLDWSHPFSAFLVLQSRLLDICIARSDTQSKDLLTDMRQLEKLEEKFEETRSTGERDAMMDLIAGFGLNELLFSSLIAEKLSVLDAKDKVLVFTLPSSATPETMLQISKLAKDIKATCEAKAIVILPHAWKLNEDKTVAPMLSILERLKDHCTKPRFKVPGMGSGLPCEFTGCSVYHSSREHPELGEYCLSCEAYALLSVLGKHDSSAS